MSTHNRDREYSNGQNIEQALQPHIQVEEKGQRTIENYPSDIARQLKRAAFSEAEAANTYVKHVQPTNNSNNSKVATVEIREEGLVIDVEDVVGIVNLTPNATLQIDPKIGWGEILDMFLAVGEQRRSLEYRGIPIREFLADDIGIEDVFIVVALNYLDSLEDVFRHGLMRSFDRNRTEGLDGRGRIDIEKSLLNFDLPNGVPKHEFVEKTIEYSIPVNDVIYQAGRELEKLFHLYASTDQVQSYTQIFSRVERSVRRLEQRGVIGKSISLRDVSQVTEQDIPRQRYYYSDALQISKTILSSTIGQPLDQGREELLMEYIIGMESLFESYVGLSLEEELEKLQSQPFIKGVDDISVAKESYQMFEDDDLTLSSQPDHVISKDGDPVAILDSKYYAKGKDPLEGSWSRSRLLSYGFQLETDQLGMIAPLANPRTHRFNQRSGSLHIIAPEEETFTTDGIRSSIQGFLEESIADQKDMGLTEDMKNRTICHPDVEPTSVEDVISVPELQTESLVEDARLVLKYITNDARLSNEAGPRGTPYMGPLRKFKRYLEEQSEGYDVAVPFFIPSEDNEAAGIKNDEDILDESPGLEDCEEFIRIHYLSIENGSIKSCDTPAPFGISW
jgi:5-methylcytosine-specific restriction endonuclease McrBC regulatory subunit McrC